MGVVEELFYSITDMSPGTPQYPKGIMKDFPYTEQIIKDKVKPHPRIIWNWGIDNYSGGD